MKWKSNSKVPETVRDKIQLIISNFDAFIKDTHGTSDTQQDEKVFKDWKQFKELLDANPDDVDSHQEFISKMSEISKSRESRTRQSIRKTSSRLDLAKTTLERRKSRDYELDKEKLRTSIHSFLTILEGNNRDILKI